MISLQLANRWLGLPFPIQFTTFHFDFPAWQSCAELRAHFSYFSYFFLVRIHTFESSVKLLFRFDLTSIWHLPTFILDLQSSIDNHQFPHFFLQVVIRTCWLFIQVVICAQFSFCQFAFTTSNSVDLLQKALCPIRLSAQLDSIFPQSPFKFHRCVQNTPICTSLCKNFFRLSEYLFTFLIFY